MIWVCGGGANEINFSADEATKLRIQMNKIVEYLKSNLTQEFLEINKFLEKPILTTMSSQITGAVRSIETGINYHKMGRSNLSNLSLKNFTQHMETIVYLLHKYIFVYLQAEINDPTTSKKKYIHDKILPIITYIITETSSLYLNHHDLTTSSPTQ